MPAIRDWSYNTQINATTTIDCALPVYAAGDVLLANLAADTGAQVWTGLTPLVGAASVDDPSAAVDDTIDANDVGTNDMELVPASPEVNDGYYFGGRAKFTMLRVNIGTAGVATWTITWKYWNGGSWATLSNVADGTTGFTAAAGNRDVTFNQPADWAANTVASITAYWVKAEITAFTSMATRPLGTQAWVRDWVQLFSAANTANTGRAYKIATATEADPLFSYTVADQSNITILAIRDIDSKTPFAEGTYASLSEATRDADVNVNDTTTGIAQSFTGTGGVLSTCQFYLKKIGSPTGNAVAKIYAHSGTFGTASIPTGTALATSDNVDVSTLTGSLALKEFIFSGVANQFVLVNATNYVLAIEYTGTASDYIQAGYDTGNGHAGNYASFASASWTADNTRDVCFYVKFFTFTTANTAASRVAAPTMTTTRNDSLLVYTASTSAVGVPGFVEGPVTGLVAKDGTGFGDGTAWTIQRATGTSPGNIFFGVGIASPVAIMAVGAVNPPSTGATVIPPYNPADASIYIDPIHGVVAFNTNTAFAATYTTHFGSTLNGMTAANGTAAAGADRGVNSYHGMGNLTGVTTVGTWSGATLVLAAGNKPDVAGKNVIVHTRPTTPSIIQTTDNITKTGVKGVAFGMASASNVDYRVWHVHGAGTAWNYGRLPIVINDGNTTGRIQNTGGLNNASILAFGFAVSGFAVAPVWGFGSLWVLDTTTVCGGVAAEPLAIDGIINIAAVGHERWSVLQQALNQMLILQPIQIGDGGTNSVYLDLNQTATEFPKQYDVASKQVYYCSVDNVAGLIYYPGASDTIKHRNSLISSSSRYKWGLHASASTSATYDFSGTAVIGAGTITLGKAITVTGLTINNYSTLDATALNFDAGTILNVPAGNDTLTTSAATLIENSTITVTGVTAGNRWCSVASPVIFENNTFIGSASTGHAIRITSTTGSPFAFVGNTFTSFGADGTTSAAIYNDSGGAITLNISGGGNNPTVRNGAGASTIVSSPVTFKVTVKNLDTGDLIENARVLVPVTTGANFPYQVVVTITSAGTTATVAHATHGRATGDNILIAGANEDDYNGAYTITKIDANSYSYTMIGDPASPATTATNITATMVLLNGFTNASGVITDSRTYSAAQPVSGWARRHTYGPSFDTATWTDASSTLTKTGAFAGMSGTFLITITAGTNMTPGIYLATWVNANDVTLPGAAGSADSTNVEFVIGAKPLYRQAPVADTVSNTGGLSVTVFLQPDE